MADRVSYHLEERRGPEFGRACVPGQRMT